MYYFLSKPLILNHNLGKAGHVITFYKTIKETLPVLWRLCWELSAWGESINRPNTDKNSKKYIFTSIYAALSAQTCPVK